MIHRSSLLKCLLPLLALAAGGCVSRPPTIAHVHLGHALTGVHVTPGKQGYLLVAEKQAEDIVTLAEKASRGADLAQLKTDVAAAVKATNSADEFGLKHSLVMASNHISFAATSPDAANAAISIAGTRRPERRSCSRVRPGPERKVSTQPRLPQ